MLGAGLLALAGLFALPVSMVTFGDGRYANKEDDNIAHAELREDHAVLVGRFEAKITRDSRNDLRKQIWAWDDRYGDGCERCPPEVQKEYRGVKAELQETKQRLTRQEAMLEQRVKQTRRSPQSAQTDRR